MQVSEPTLEDLARMFVEFVFELCDVSPDDSQLIIAIKIRDKILRMDIDKLKTQFRKWLREKKGLDIQFFDQQFYKIILLINERQDIVSEVLRKMERERRLAQ